MNNQACKAIGDRKNRGCRAMLLPKDIKFGEGQEGTQGLNILLEVMENSKIAATANPVIVNTVPNPKDEQGHEPHLMGEEIRKNLQSLYTDVLKKIQDNLGQMYITSGYRCLTLNEELSESVGGSWHLYGLAADFTIDGMSSPEDVCNKVKEAGIGKVLKELIPVPEFNYVHVALKADANSIA